MTAKKPTSPYAGLRKYLPSKQTAKAVVAALVALAAYLAGVFPGDAGLIDGLGQITGLQWLGAIVFLGGAYGLTYRVPNAK